MSEIRPEGYEEEIPVVDVVETVEEAPVEAPKPPVGERLRLAREARGMACAEVAQALKLSPRQVEALEAGDWAKLPGHTFIRGFVRNYARVVQLPADELLVDLEAPAPAAPRLHRPPSTQAVLPESGRAQKRDYATVLAGLVFVAIAVVAYFVVPPDFWMSGSSEPKPEVSASTEPAPLFPPSGLSQTESAEAMPPAMPPAVPVEEKKSDKPAEKPLDKAADRQDKPTVPAAPAAAPAVAPVAPAAAPAPGSARLQMSFTQPSWVEIRDKTGQIIYSQLNQPGSQREVDGVPPFVMVVGNASHVTVRYKGRDIDLQPRSKDDVARVTVE